MRAFLFKPVSARVETYVGDQKYSSTYRKNLHRLYVPDEEILISWYDTTIMCKRVRQFMWLQNELWHTFLIHKNFVEKIRTCRNGQNELLQALANLEVEAEATKPKSVQIQIA